MNKGRNGWKESFHLPSTRFINPLLGCTFVHLGGGRGRKEEEGSFHPFLPLFIGVSGDGWKDGGRFRNYCFKFRTFRKVVYWIGSM
jgi:hypothetical protein